jgi:hypothetical protein
MSKKVGVDLSNLFSGAEYSQEVHTLESKIAELSAEIEQLRSSGSQELEAKIQELREQLASGGVLDVLSLQCFRETGKDEPIKLGAKHPYCDAHYARSPHRSGSRRKRA